MVQDTHRILKICRGTEDVDILRGAATVLVSANWVRMAEPELIAKIISASPSSQLVEAVFGGIRGYSEGDEVNRRDKERAISRTVAELVLDDPERWPFAIVSRAANFLTETEASISEALFEAHPDLVYPEHGAVVGHD